MKRRILAGTATALALLLVGCGSNEQATQNEAAADPMNQVMADPNNPFAQSEMQMSERMMAAVGADVGDSWVRKMIEHHQGAIDMSRIVLQQNPTADVARLAQETIDKQTGEIADLRDLAKEGTPNQQSAEVYRPAMMQMHEAMMAATGANVSETFMRKMLEHHRGGVALSEVALNNGATGAVRTAAQETRVSQQEEAQMVEAMLSGEPLEQAMQEPSTMSAEQTEAEAAPAAARAEPRRRPTAEAEPEAAPPAPPEPEPEAPASTCTDEHRAMGHC